MSTPVTYVANQYNVPAYQDTGYAQGAGNLSSYLIALATGSLTLSGGTFTLTADADFGASFGLKSIYYKSRATNPASTGVIRLGSAEVIAWRNNANNGNLPLTTDASDRLTFDGFVIATSSGALNGTTLTLTATSNQMVIGTTNTTTVSFTAPASSATYTVPDVGTTANFILSAGTQTIGGAKTFSSAVSLTAASNQLVFNPAAGNTVTINLSSAPAGSVVYTLPDVGGAAAFVMTAGTQTIAGAKTFSSAIAITATSNHLVLSTASNTLTINANSQATSPRIWSIPDISGAGTFAALEGTQTFTGAKTFSSTLSVANTGFQIGGNQVFPVLQIIVGTLTSAFSTTSSTFQASGLKAVITPKFNTSKIKITVSSALKATNTTLAAARATLERNASNLGAAVGFTEVNGNQATPIYAPLSIVYYDSPASTSALTYEVYILSTDNTTAAVLNASSQTSVIIAEEITQ